MSDAKNVVYGGICCAILITGSVLLGVSFSTISPNNVAFDYNGNTLTIDESQLYTNGRYFLGVGHSFITYSTLQKNILFQDGASGADDVSLTGRTQDGLAITLDVSFQYRLIIDKDTLLDLYYDFATDFKPTYIKIARSVMRDVVSTYTAFAVIESRESLAADMETELNEALSAVYAEVPSLQLLNIDLPDEFENAIERTVVAEQDVEKAQYEQSTAQITAETTVLQAQYDAEIILLEANASAEALVVERSAEASAIALQLDAEANAYAELAANFKASFGEDNFTPDDLLSYIWLQSISETSAGNIIMDVDKPQSMDFGS